MRTSFPIVLTAFSLLATAVLCRADSNVVISAFASPEYTRRKYEGERIKPEKYVVMQGQYFEGATVDRSIERMPFRRILDFFAPELARCEYWPAPNLREADLLVVVHWGTTVRMPLTTEMRAQSTTVTDTSMNVDVIARNALIQQYSFGDQAGIGAWMNAADPALQQLTLDNIEVVTEQVRTEFGMATNAQLLGYTGTLRKLNTTLNIDPLEITLKSDMSSERYFVILRAYDLHEKVPPGKPRTAVWTLHLNMRSPGMNFSRALDRMSATATKYFGRASDGVVTIAPRLREGKVEVGTPVVIEKGR